MAKVTAPLMSLDASGKYGGALVFTKWKGRPCVRQLVKPSNPRSANQMTTRNAQRVAAEAQKWANRTSMIEAGETETDKARLIPAAPAGQAWNGLLVASVIGTALIEYDAAAADYAALQAGEKAAWVAAAEALTPPIAEVAQFSAGGVPASNLSAGEVFFHYRWGLAKAGIVADYPAATPPTYA